MKNNSYIKYIATAGICVIFLLILLAGNSKSIMPEKISPLKKETEVYVDIEKESVQQIDKENEYDKGKENIVAADQSSLQATSHSGNTSKENESIGELPPISANYRRYVGFKRYSEEMVKLDCRFFIFSENSNNLYEIDFNNKSLKKVNIKNLQNGVYSNKSRLITDEPFLDKYIKLVMQKI